MKENKSIIQNKIKFSRLNDLIIFRLRSSQLIKCININKDKSLYKNNKLEDELEDIFKMQIEKEDKNKKITKIKKKIVNIFYFVNNNKELSNEELKIVAPVTRNSELFLDFAVNILECANLISYQYTSTRRLKQKKRKKYQIKLFKIRSILLLKKTNDLLIKIKNYLV